VGPIDLGLGVSLWDLEISKSGQDPHNPLSDNTANPCPYCSQSSTQQQEAVWPNSLAQDNISPAILTPEESSPSTLVPSSSESPSEVPPSPSATTTPAYTERDSQNCSPEHTLDDLPPAGAFTIEAQISSRPSISEPISSPNSSLEKTQYQCSTCSKTFDRRYKLK
jgi:DNA-directed RNA polymerase subunit RPC12/RpoP